MRSPPSLRTHSGDTFSMSTQDLLHPELMSDSLLRRILQDRGLCTGDEVGRWQLLEFYNALVLPKPKREITEFAGSQEHDSSFSYSGIRLFPKSHQETSSNGIGKRSPKSEQANVEEIGHDSSGVSASEIVQISATTRSHSQKRPSQSERSTNEPPPAKRKIVPITFP